MCRTLEMTSQISQLGMREQIVDVFGVPEPSIEVIPNGIDPEDLQAHYNLMLCYNGLGQEKLAKEHEERYLRFKADEASQAITGPYRQLHPEDNNERQQVHEHVSVALGSHVGTATSAVRPGKARQRAPQSSPGFLFKSRY